jgi:hypothetical protein
VGDCAPPQTHFETLIPLALETAFNGASPRGDHSTGRERPARCRFPAGPGGASIEGGAATGRGEAREACAVAHAGSSTLEVPPVSRARNRNSGRFVVSNLDDHSRPRAAAVRHVLLLPRLGVASRGTRVVP